MSPSRSAATLQGVPACRATRAEAEHAREPCSASPTPTSARSTALHTAAPRRRSAPKTINWFLPDIDSPFYGGVNTVLRLADHLARDARRREPLRRSGPRPNEAFFRSAIAAAFPDARRLADRVPRRVARVARPAARSRRGDRDAVGDGVLRRAVRGARAGKFYMIQDFEPMFYPAGTLYALAEESYRLGLYGLCNTEHMLRALRAAVRRAAACRSSPRSIPTVFHAEGRNFDRTLDQVATVFVYARARATGGTAGSWRRIALEELKRRLGDRVRIVTAGSWATPDDLGSGIEHLGLLDYRATGDFYRTCDVGVALTVSEHPSYLPLELMACGVPVVAFDNPAGHWLLRDRENWLLARRTVDGLGAAIERIVLDPELGRHLSRGSVARRSPNTTRAGTSRSRGSTST